MAWFYLQQQQDKGQQRAAQGQGSSIVDKYGISDTKFNVPQVGDGL